LNKLIRNITIGIWLCRFVNPVFAGSAERIILFTDRSLYVAGEYICFSATIIPENNPSNIVPSKVLYIEIITNNNHQIIAQKFQISNAISMGIIDIPHDLSAGIYYIKAYTKYMRNWGPESYSYNQIYVIQSNENNNQYEHQAADNHETYNLLIPGYDNYGIFEIETNKIEYKQKDSVFIKIRTIINPDSVKSACLSVVPDNSNSNNRIVTENNVRMNAEFKFKPEYNGISLTGLLRDPVSSEPLPSQKVDLTIFGKYSDFISVHTNSKGRFYFSLPFNTGQGNIFISAEKSDSLIPSILIDNDFCSYPVNLPYHKLTLSETEQKTALNLLRNFQITRSFGTEILQLTNESGTNNYSVPFYGEPVKKLVINDYVQLPTLENYFNELSYLVKVRKFQGKKYLKIQGDRAEIDIYQPLILIDMVVVYDIDLILPLSSNSISHIDIINEPYVKGNMIYGGIVSIISKNNDFGGINLPQSGTFITYDFLSNSTPVINSSTVDDIPDARNTLYWNGNFSISGDPTTEISFLTGNSQGLYDIILKGILQNGTVFSQTVSFKVE
jgi:hypothetical protein